MKILHVTPSFYPATVYGGPIEVVYQLCCHLAQAGCEVRVLTTDTNGLHSALDVVKDREVEVTGGLCVRYCPRRIRHSVSPTLLRLLPSYVRWADVVYLTAIYNFPTIPTLVACGLLGKPLVWSPRGALQRWKGSRHRVLKALWETVCRAVAPKPLVLHVTSEEEARESRLRFPKASIAVIPNGMEVPYHVEPVLNDGRLRLLYLGRLDPKKGIENLLEACARLNGRLSIPWNLTIAGGGDPRYVRALRARIDALGLAGQVRMVGEVAGDAKRRVFEEDDLVVVPSYTENFAMVVAEALAHGVPVVASRGTPWRRVEEIGCGLWVDNDPESLAEAVIRMAGMPLREMGQRGRDWIKQEFSWSNRARQMAELYQSLVRTN